VVALYKKSIHKLTELLRALEANRGDYKLLLRLQRELVVRIKRTDQRIAALKQRKRALNKKKRTGGMSKVAAQAIKRRIAAVDEAISNAQWLLFLWRCFGDGVAFIYLDKYAIKHMLYNTHDYSMKEAAGPLLHKEGHKREWSIVRGLAKKRLPAILCDITNILRHGDVCLLIGPDPIPIEVKSSANRNARADRQVASLKALRDFLETDEANDFRGLEGVKRIELPLCDVNHSSAMNECIQRSRSTGFAAIAPEDGLIYAALRSREAVEHLASYIQRECMLTLLNETKNEARWPPYYPFTLSIREPLALCEFISGNVTLAVLLDAQAVIRAFAGRGLHAQFVEHPASILVVSRLGAVRDKDAFSAISTAFFARLFYEFETIGALADMELALIQKMEKMTLTEIQTTFDSGELKAGGPLWPEFKPMRWSDRRLETCDHLG
jgi:hypothetical protein